MVWFGKCAKAMWHIDGAKKFFTREFTDPLVTNGFHLECTHAYIATENYLYSKNVVYFSVIISILNFLLMDIHNLQGPVKSET